MTWSVSSTLPVGVDLEIEDAKILLREAIRAHRQKRSPRECQKAAAQIAEQTAPMLEGVRCAAIYASRKHEPGTEALLELMHERGIRILMPVLGEGLSRDWATYEPGEPLEVRAPGRPPEPPGPGIGEHAVAEADLVIVPALSVDDDGCRLGQGGGWYDRVLGHVAQSTPVFALIYDDEFSDKPLPRAAHDHPVDGIITQTMVRRLR